MSLSSPPEKVPGAGNQPDKRSDDELDGESKVRSDSANEDEPSPAEDEPQRMLEEDSDSEEEALDTASKALDGACCDVGMKITSVPGNFIQVPQFCDQSMKAEVEITVALRPTSESKAVKRTRSLSAEHVSDNDLGLVADEIERMQQGSPKHKRLKVC